ncbi:MAG: hypothetical protein Q6356_009145 [Candidatus Wukongarchaeota archaeon]|nr:hypothetical protein [Candidatus Wukongarchaeota archaeon]
MSRGLRVEERIPGVAYVVRLRKDQSIGWVVEIILRNSVEKLIQLVSLDSNVLSTSLKNAFRELEVYSVTEIQIEMAAHNLLNKLSQLTAPPQPQPKQQPAPAPTTAPVPVAQPQQTPPATAAAPSAAQPTYTVQQPAVGTQQDIRDIVVKLVDKITELAARVASLETRVSQLESYLYK